MSAPDSRPSLLDGELMRDPHVNVALCGVRAIWRDATVAERRATLVDSQPEGRRSH
jgi:hypothetical protein